MSAAAEKSSADRPVKQEITEAWQMQQWLTCGAEADSMHCGKIHPVLKILLDTDHITYTSSNREEQMHQWLACGTEADSITSAAAEK